MAYIDRKALKEEYPYFGTFYIKGEEHIGDDGDLFDDAIVVEDTVVLETKCDITETSRAFASGAITASYDVYFPLGDDEEIVIDRGQMFKANIRGLNILGMVISVGHSQLGGVHAYIKSTEV